MVKLTKFQMKRSGMDMWCGMQVRQPCMVL
jgi:hypothetical protein